MGLLYLGGPTIQEVDGEMMMGLSIYGVFYIWGCCNGWVVILQILRYIANVTQRKFEIVQKKSRSREYNYLIISIIKNVERASTARAHARVARDFHVRGTE